MNIYIKAKTASSSSCVCSAAPACLLAPALRDTDGACGPAQSTWGRRRAASAASASPSPLISSAAAPATAAGSRDGRRRGGLPGLAGASSSDGTSSSNTKAAAPGAPEARAGTDACGSSHTDWRVCSLW